VTGRADVALKVEDLRVSFDAGGLTVRAVDGISFEARRGETLALVGESGCGKSTTALALMRLLPERRGCTIGGRVMLDGEDLMALPQRAMRRIRGRRMAMIFQEPMTSLNPVLTVRQQIAETILAHERVSRHAAAERTVSLLNEVGIPEPAARAEAYPHQLSGGMRQRVMIAAALACGPEVLVADEPTTALDVTIQAQILDLLRTLMERHGMALILITHDLGVVADFADRVAVMYAGRIAEEADVAPFFARPSHPYSQGLLLARPSATSGELRRFIEIPGRAARNSGAARGCLFASRCPLVVERCSVEAPPLAPAGEDGGWHNAACHRAGEEAWSGPTDTTLRRTWMGAEAPLLAVRDLAVHYPARRGGERTVIKAVDGASIDVLPGETHALVGESGCGKSTVARAVLGLTAATGGSVSVGGNAVDVTDQSGLTGLRRTCQIVFQDPFASLNARLRIGASIGEPLENFTTLDSRARRERVSALLERVGLSADRAADYPHQFSGGQRQRICIARALAVEPRLIVCDEPVSALDVSIQAQILNLLADIQAETGVSLLFITHDLAVVGSFAHRVSVMYLGRIVESGTVSEIFLRPRHPYTSLLLRSAPGANAVAEGMLSPRGSRPVRTVGGELPSPFSPPPGCAFHPRCPRATELCRRQRPELVSGPSGRQFACHHPLD